MNQKIRQYLIDQCRANRPIFYEDVAKQLNLDLSLDNDRNILSTTLGDISAFENQYNRPLISAVVIYKNKNDHGYGFYDLCESLGIGNAKKLSKDLYGFTALEESRIYWQNNGNYHRFYDLKRNIYDKHKNPFFNNQELIFFSEWANEVYHKDDSVHFSAKQYILNTVWSKTKFWSDEVVKRLSGYECSNIRAWSQLGWDNGKRVSKFKPYTWARIYKKGDFKKNIFFTVGVDAVKNKIVYKLDYHYETDSTLSGDQKTICSKHIPTHLRWNTIDFDELNDWDWEALIDLVVDFITENDHHYDKIIELVWFKKNPDDIFSDYLTRRNKPKSTLNELPEMSPSFAGGNVDFIKKNIENKELGDLGEELVRLHEILILEKKGLFKLAENVKIVEDGKGYDILSFDKNGREKYIEVKTTSGGEETPFNFTINEKLFAETKPDQYVIYRLYNFDEEKNTADFFEITDIDKELLLQPTEFKVYLKNI